jgi:hypothetical protein
MVKRSRERAERHDRWFQDRLMGIPEGAVSAARPLTPDKLVAKVRRLGLSTSGEAAAMIRKDRDGR